MKIAKEQRATEDKHAVHMYWMQARDIPKYEAPFQKVCCSSAIALDVDTYPRQCILAYLSDLHLYGAVLVSEQQTI